jgi:hypothetical protein
MVRRRQARLKGRTTSPVTVLRAMLVACDMAREQKARLAVEERNLNHRERTHLRVRGP